MLVVLASCTSTPERGEPGHRPAVPSTSGSGGATASSTSSSNTSTSSATGGGEIGEIPPEACRFDSEIAFNLPPGFATDQLDDLAADDSGSCSEGELSYAVRDMDGDLRPDLVVADRCDLANVGTDAWQVYLNDGTRFDDAATTWSLPAGFSTDQLDDLADDGSGSCVVGELSFGLHDMNGDMRPDLVVFDDCDIGEVGSDRWLVFLNEGAGFADAPSNWTLPTGFQTDAFDDVSGDEGCIAFQGELSHTLLDVDGDLRPDLVVTDNCDIGEVGTDHWLVYANLGTGFSDVPTFWSLPQDFATDDLDDVAGDDGGFCNFGRVVHGLRDMDGDRRPDLVITDNCDVGDVGASHWMVYLNQGDRFADIAITWTLPGQQQGDAYDQLTRDDSGTCSYGELSYATVDADGDLAADLLVTDDCDQDHVGTTHWILFRANLTVFDEALAWTLPAAYGFDALDDIEQDSYGKCVGGELSTAAIDIDGDRVLDLVVADDCDLDGVGTTHWRVFKGSCD